VTTGEEVQAYGVLRRLAYTIAFRSACGDILSQESYDRLFDDFQLLSEGSFALVWFPYIWHCWQGALSPHH
jgi:hypothetical protein